MQEFVHDSHTRIASLTGADSEPLVTLFEAIACAEGWQPGEQLRAHQAASTYFAAYVDGELAGGMQIVLPDTSGRLPFQAVWPDVDVGTPAGMAHVPILAIRPEFRGPLRLFWPLCVELWRFCALRGVERIVIEATPAMLARYRRIGWSLEVIGDLRLHWGEECCLCQANVQAVAGALLARALRSPGFRALVGHAMRPVQPSDCADLSALP